MYEVYLRLRFDTPCLGNLRREDPHPNTMMRDHDGNIIFSQVWWRAIVLQAASTRCLHQEQVRNILWSPEVDGTVKLHKRYYSLNGQRFYKEHEAFLANDVIGVKALIPDDITIEDLTELMGIAGAYYGISPFGWKQGFGKFKVVEIARTVNRGHTSVEDRNKGQPDEAVPGVDIHDIPAGNDSNVHAPGTEQVSQAQVVRNS